MILSRLRRSSHCVLAGDVLYFSLEIIGGVLPNHYWEKAPALDFKDTTAPRFDHSDVVFDLFIETSTVKAVYRNKKIKNLEAEIFCHAPSKQELSPA